MFLHEVFRASYSVRGASSSLVALDGSQYFTHSACVLVHVCLTVPTNDYDHVHQRCLCEAKSEARLSLVTGHT